MIQSYCHGRGGGDLGKQWYEAGRLYNKENAINDYIACANAISNKVIQIPNAPRDDNDQKEPIFLASKSFSAGGLVVAASINRCNDENQGKLFQAASLVNPFLDVMETMSNDTSSSGDYLVEHEHDEFGDPINDDKAQSLIQSYCPVSNINEHISYPPMFVVSTLDDENVPFHHGVVYTKTIRESMKIGNKDNQGHHNNILLHVEEFGGHHLHGRRLDVCTLENCFLLGYLHSHITK